MFNEHVELPVLFLHHGKCLHRCHLTGQCGQTECYIGCNASDWWVSSITLGTAL